MAAIVHIEVFFRELDLSSLFGRLALLPLPDHLAVDIGSVQAAEVADTYVGRIDVQQAMMARDLMLLVIGNPRLAVF